MILLILFAFSLILTSFPVSYQSSKCEPLLLTPYIESNRLAEAKRLSTVPDLSRDFHVKSYSGFLTVNKRFGSNLFFWFFPSQLNPDKAPVLLWLQGGPGSSSMLALFVEHGPFFVTEKLDLVQNNNSWTNDFSVLYIDNPVGTGFSFTQNKNGFARNQTSVAEDLYEGLQQFFKLFSQYRSNEFYVTGESYAGKYVPAIGYKLHQMSSTSNINFKGIAIGNGWIDPISMLDIGSFLYQIGLIDENQLNHFYDIQNKTAIDIQKKNYRDAFKLQDELIGGDLINGSSYFTNATGMTYYLNILQSNPPKDLDYFVKFLNKEQIQQQIHVGCVEYSSANITVEDYMTEDQFNTVKPWFRTLIDNYKVLIYNGQLDIIVAITLTENFLKNLDWKHSKEYSNAKRLVWSLDSDVVGYVKQVANFTQVVVRNAGHLVPYDQPRVASHMIRNFVYSKPFH